MSCFWVSLSKEMQASDCRVERQKMKQKKKRSLLSWCKSCTKTVPVDISGASYNVQIKKGKVKTFKSKSESNDYSLFSSHACHSLQHQNTPADHDPVHRNKSQEQEEKVLNLQNGKEVSAEVDVLRHNIEPPRIRSRKLGTPKMKLSLTTRNNVSTSRAKSTLTLPFSSPPYSSKHLKLSRVPTKNRKEKNIGSVKKYDPVVGMSIIMITLFIMLIWGRFCAI